MSDLIERDRRVVWHPFSPLKETVPLLVVHSARGTELVLNDGRRILDAISSWWTNLHGHGHPELVAAIHEQTKRLDHVIFAGFTHEPAVRLAEALVRLVPLENPRVFYSDNGSTAVEAALKLSVQYWRKQGERRSVFVALSNSYHGDTLGAVSAGARGLFTEQFEDLLFEVRHVDLSLPLEELERRCREVFSADVAAFIYEPLVQGVGGMAMPDAEALRVATTAAARCGALLVADEVMTGFGRTGPLFASDDLGVAPDLMCLAKGMSGGILPLAATVASERVWRPFDDSAREKAFLHGHSFTANPIACAAGLKSLELLLAPPCVERRRAIAEGHRRFAASYRGDGLVSLRSRGTILAAEVGKREGYGSALRDELYRRALDRGVLVRPLGTTIYLMPPYSTTDAELERMHEVFGGLVA